MSGIKRNLPRRRNTVAVSGYEASKLSGESVDFDVATATFLRNCKIRNLTGPTRRIPPRNCRSRDSVPAGRDRSGGASGAGILRVHKFKEALRAAGYPANNRVKEIHQRSRKDLRIEALLPEIENGTIQFSRKHALLLE
ncbi:hypothetical protein [Cohnella terricola]|uniref:Uncharacterized protein n=1 Tax=Cohnella terricola TaxID=1289167 RepID=A0A559JL66_9BACL|nr:hypothetical protein [Cohnella terricola]TVY00618.1 hypothetical protein FPZ45_11440 [Cohnella terricola]